MAYLERAAGGVVYRREQGNIEILMIVDRYGCWALPKGKLEAGESSEQAAIREIKEETGVEGEIIVSIQTLNYQYTHPQRGFVNKQVDYFLVRALSHELVPQEGEVLTARWIKPEELICGYENNLTVIEQALKIIKSK